MQEEQFLNEYKKYDYLNQDRDNPLVKIFVSYIKHSFLFKSEILTPIHLGRAVEKDNSKVTHNILSKILIFDCCHHSDAGYKIAPKSYNISLKYVNKKYPTHLFCGTCSFIGGLDFEQGSTQDYSIFSIRKKLKKERLLKLKKEEVIYA